MWKPFILIFFFRFGLKPWLFQGEGGGNNKRLDPSWFTCVEEMSQRTSCHGNAEEHEAELAPELRPQHHPPGTGGSGWGPALPRCGVVAIGAGEGLQLPSSHPASYSCPSPPPPPRRAVPPGEVTDLFICLQNAR